MGEVVKATLLPGTVVISHGSEGAGGHVTEAASIGGSLAQKAFSPTVSITDTETGIDITITDVNGSHTGSLTNGHDYSLTEEDRDEIADLANQRLEYDDEPTDDSDNLLTSGTIKEALDEKADADAIPQNVSDLVNDSGYITSADVPTNVSAFTNDAGYLTQHQDISGKQDKLTFDNQPKQYSENPVTSAGIYESIRTVKNDVSSLQGDVTSVQMDISMKADKIDLNMLQSQVDDCTDDIIDLQVGKQNKLTFDSTPTANSTNPVTSGGVYSAISNINSMNIHICGSGEYNSETGVPTVQDPDGQTFYFVPGGEGSNLYIEWIYVNSAWEQFGSATIDLSDYALKSELPTKVSDLSNDAGYLTQHQDISGKQNVLTFDNQPKRFSNNPVTSDGIYESIGSVKSDVSSLQSDMMTAQMNINMKADNADVSMLQSQVDDCVDDIIDLKASKITDVQVNGTSVLSNGVANVEVISGVHVGSTQPTDPDINVWIDPNGEGLDGIDEAVSDWLDDHPEATTTVQDGSITKAKLDANLQAAVDDVDELKSATSGRLLSDEIKIALLACFQNIAWITPNGQTYYDALESALNPPANLSYITAVYTQTMTVETIDPITVLRDDLAVTAHYGDGTSSRVYGYLLSGTLTEGTSTVTVTYGGKTATFSVTVSPAYLTHGRTYTLNSQDNWRMAKGMSYIWENSGKSYDSLVTDSAGTRAMTYLFPVAPGGITLKWNSNAYEIVPSFWDTNECWKYMAFNSNVYLTVSPSSYNAADIASYGVKYFAVGLKRKDDAALTDADITAANIQLEVL